MVRCMVLAGLGMFAVRIGGTQQQTINLGLLGDRAWAAANSGIEFSAFRAFSAGNCLTANATFNLTDTALAGFRVQVTCTPMAGGQYTFTSFADRGTYGSPDYVSRRLIRTM